MEENNQTSPQTTTSFKAHLRREQIREDYTQVTKLNLKGSRAIHHLGFMDDWSSFDDIPFDSNKFFKPLEKLKYINDLYVSLYQTTKEEVITKDFSEKLRSLTSLESLNLQFGSAGWLSLEGMGHLANALGDLKRLSKLTLNLNSCINLDDECFNVLFHALKKHKKLQSFDLNVGYPTDITEKTFKNLASLLKSSFKSLEEFSLTSYNPTMEGSALEFLASGLQHLTCLKKLRIPYLTVQASQENDGSSLMSSVGNLKSLRILDLDLSSFQKNLATIHILVTSLKYFSDLRSLILNFQNTETFSLQEMEVLAQSFQTFPLLENLALDFRDCPCIDDKALEKLSASLKGFTELSKIALLFDQCPLVGDAGVESLVSQLIDLNNLDSITLSFLSCTPIKHEHYNRLEMNKNYSKMSLQYERSEFF